MNAAGRPEKRPRPNNHPMDPTDNTAREQADPEVEERSSKESDNLEGESSDNTTLKAKYTNAAAPTAHSTTITVAPAPSLSKPEHGKLKALKGTNADHLRALHYPHYCAITGDDRPQPSNQATRI